MTKKKNYPITSRSWIDKKVNDIMDEKHSFNLGHKKAKFNLGWYTGENFRIFSLKICEILLDGELTFICLFEIQVAYLSVSFTIFPFD